MKAKRKPTVAEKHSESPLVRKLLNERHKLHVNRKSGVLYRNQQVVLPQIFRTVYRELHEDMGHLGVERVLALARERFYWPHMRRDIENFIHHTCRCLKQRRPNLPTREPLQPILTTAPLQMVSIDFYISSKALGATRISWLLLLTISQNMHKRTRREIKLLLLLQTRSLMISSHASGSQRNSTTIWEAN